MKGDEKVRDASGRKGRRKKRGLVIPPKPYVLAEIKVAAVESKTCDYMRPSCYSTRNSNLHKLMLIVLSIH